VRVLLDENLPVDLARELSPHTVETVSGLGWTGTKNGELLRRMTGRFDTLLTMDQNLEFQQRLSGRSFGVLLLIAKSNRMSDLRPLVPDVLRTLSELQPAQLRRIGP
jgi:hypothetical protein